MEKSEKKIFTWYPLLSGVMGRPKGVWEILIKSIQNRFFLFSFLYVNVSWALNGIMGIPLSCNSSEYPQDIITLVQMLRLDKGESVFISYLRQVHWNKNQVNKNSEKLCAMKCFTIKSWIPPLVGFEPQTSYHDVKPRVLAACMMTQMFGMVRLFQ